VLPLAVAVDARPTVVKLKHVTLDGSKQFITKANDRLEVPFEGSNLRFGEYKAAAGKTVKLSLHLAHLVARVRAAFGAWLSLSKLADDGLSIRLRCYHAPKAKKPVDQRTPEAHAKLVAAAKATFDSVTDDGEFVTVSVPAPGTGAGALTLELNPEEAFAAALKARPPKDDERLHVTFGFVFPCGGRHVEVLEPGRTAEKLGLDAVEEACGAELIQAWAPATSTALSQPRIRDLKVKVTKTRTEGWIELSATLAGGTYAEWERARPRFAWVGASGKEHPVGAKVRSKHLLEGHVSLVEKDLPRGDITFIARVTAEETVFDGDVVPVPPVQVTLDPRKKKDAGA
jgi:hypothetical protein